MGRKIQVMIADKLVDGEEMEFTPIAEIWNSYKVKDGTIIQLKAIVTKIIKTKMKHPITGDPIYSISSQNVVNATMPKSAKRKRK